MNLELIFLNRTLEDNDLSEQINKELEITLSEVEK
jgi:hypothetical protein